MIKPCRKTCKHANVPVPPEVYERLNAISDGQNQIHVKAELETNGESKRFRVKVSDIVNTNSDFVYFEFEKFKSKDVTEEEDNDLEELILEEPTKGAIAKFFGVTEKDKEEFDYL